MAKRAIKKGIANTIEMVLMGNYPRYQQQDFKMGHQEAFDFICTKSDSSHYEQQQTSLQMMYFLQ